MNYKNHEIHYNRKYVNKYSRSIFMKHFKILFIDKCVIFIFHVCLNLKRRHDTYIENIKLDKNNLVTKGPHLDFRISWKNQLFTIHYKFTQSGYPYMVTFVSSNYHMYRSVKYPTSCQFYTIMFKINHKGVMII